MEIGKNFAVRVDDKAGTEILGGLQAIEKSLAVDRAGDVGDARTGHLINVDIVHLVRAEARGPRDIWTAPQRSGGHAAPQQGIRLGGDIYESADNRGGEDQGS